MNEPTHASPSTPALISMRAITKRFPGVVALSDVSLHLRQGEVLALMGENGAGKSTLMKVLGGAHEPDEGQISIDGRDVQISSVRQAKALGIALIHQELMLAPNLDIAANIFLGNERDSGWLLSPLPRPQMNAQARKLLERVGLNRSPTTPVSSLTSGQMQMVEIAKALALNARIIIMDEPTSSLTTAESEHLFKIIRQLRSEQLGIVYISHRLDEVLQLADRITVLRDGQYVGDLSRDEATHEKIVSMMVGRELSTHYFPPKHEQPEGDPILEVKDLIVPGAPAGVSFSAKPGEILGFAGLVGAGRTELMCTLFGVTPPLGGNVRLAGRAYTAHHPQEAIAQGVFLAPEDRKLHGLVLGMSIAQNVSLPDVRSYNRWGWLDRKIEKRVADAEIERLKIKAYSVHQRVINLSGGNQQKVVLGKWLAMNPRVLILDEPTRGIDVGAKAEIYRHMAELASEGISILMVSSDMEEIIGISDRVVVMHERRVTGILSRDELSQERIASLMTGGQKEGEAA